MPRRHALGPLLAVPLVAMLAGCLPLPPLPGIAPERTPIGATSVPVPTGDCLVVDQPAVQLFGDCRELVVEGQGLDIDVGIVGTLVIRGDRNEVDAREIGSLTIEGQDNEVDVDRDLGTLEIRGDRNEVEVDGQIGTVRIAGNENEVDADRGIGAIDDEGDRNRIES